MANAWGTLVLSDTLGYAYPNIRDYGEANMAADVARLLAAYNRVVRDELGTLAEFTTERIMGYAGNVQNSVVRADEFGRADTQKAVVTGNLGFPLWLEQYSIQWTRKWMETHTPIEMLEQMEAAQTAFLLGTQGSLRQTLFTPTNTTFLDKLVDNYSLSVKALANADSAPIPTGPNGEQFNAGTHTHYLVCATPGTPVAADMVALITTVAEHYNVGQVYVYINGAQEATVRGFSGFTALTPTIIVPPTTAAAVRAPLDTGQLYNRRIGIFGNQGAEVWVKPWIPAAYMMAFIVGPETAKVVVIRERRAGSMDVQIAADNEQYPLRAETLEREYGTGIRNRIGAACLDCTNGSYTTPTGI